MKRLSESALTELFAPFANKSLETSIIILSYGKTSKRCSVKEFYGKTLNKSLENFFTFYRTLVGMDYVRIDLIVKEKLVTYEELNEKIGEINRNNYLTFGIRIDGLKKRLFLKEEMVANALLVPDKNHKIGINPPNLSFDLSNFKSYVNKKYHSWDYSLKYLSKSKIYLFETKAFFIENDSIYELKEYGFGNHFRVIDKADFEDTLDLVVTKGAEFLSHQLSDKGKFIYGYFPCYDKIIKNYNAIRHFSSLYALFETGESLSDQKLIAKALQGLHWGFENLSDTVAGDLIIKDHLGREIEYKLGAQALAILAAAKYTQITGDTQFFDKMRSLIKTVEKQFITENAETIHVFDENLEVKDKFRIIYYDGEILFSLLRAYELMKEEEIFILSKGLMTRFVENNYEKYHDHWLSYAVNEFLKHEQKKEYFIFGMKNALNRIDFIEKRDTAYPTMLELLVAAAKMMLKLETYEHRQEVISDEEFYKRKKRIVSVMHHRAFHEMVTGTMFPEFAMFFKAPYKITYGFFARHDRFRMRIDDAEHFLSGFVNYRGIVEALSED
ncbi:hypothetical protein ACWN8V_07825 [Vagococcus elongatus]|uniref:Glycosyl transferase family 1 n=1 Tax=Vagococcus elongatus TaxID=180344 RepID=A0A430AU02_9ENTE|nr:hypothetical protein [Vagococcus elongatus]RSU11537.1 hypothetical protein CBF29_07585 [Vagococcus elongatus]